MGASVANLAQLGFQGKDFGLFIRKSHPFATFNQDFVFVAGRCHETIGSESNTIIIIFLLLFHVLAEIGVSGREVTLEEVGKKILSGFTSSSQLINCVLDKAIELINVTFHLLQLAGREERCSRRILVVAWVSM